MKITLISLFSIISLFFTLDTACASSEIELEVTEVPCSLRTDQPKNSGQKEPATQSSKNIEITIKPGTLLQYDSLLEDAGNHSRYKMYMNLSIASKTIAVLASGFAGLSEFLPASDETQNIVSTSLSFFALSLVTLDGLWFQKYQNYHLDAPEKLNKLIMDEAKFFLSKDQNQYGIEHAMLADKVNLELKKQHTLLERDKKGCITKIWNSCCKNICCFASSTPRSTFKAPTNVPYQSINNGSTD